MSGGVILQTALNWTLRPLRILYVLGGYSFFNRKGRKENAKFAKENRPICPRVGYKSVFQSIERTGVIVLDNARYQHGKWVKALAEEWNITLERGAPVYTARKPVKMLTGDAVSTQL